MRIKNLLNSITGAGNNGNTPVQCQQCQLYFYEKDMPIHLKFCSVPQQIQPAAQPAQNKHKQQPSLVLEEQDDDEGFVVVSSNTPEKPSLSASQRTQLLLQHGSNNYEQFYGFNQQKPLFPSTNNTVPQLSDEELARKLYEEELESFKKQQEMEEQLTIKLLQQESAKTASFTLASPYKHQQLNNTAVCDHCKSTVDFSKAIFGEKCSHTFCASCVLAHTQHVVEKEAGDIEAVHCLCCQSILPSFVIKSCISNDEFERLSDVSFKNMVGKNGLVRCPNSKCHNVMEVEQRSLAAIIADLQAQKKDHTSEAEIHREQHRIRCRACNLEFCTQCFVTPYHESYTCDQYADYLKSKHCRFCSAKLQLSDNLQTLICGSEECHAKSKICCDKILPCSHLCYGIKNEEKCLPCLHEDCKRDKALQQGDDYCNICFVEGLNQAPTIELGCGHMFHYECIKKKLTEKWPGARITFGFMNCPLCNQTISHPALLPELTPLLELKATVEEKCLARIKIEGMEKHDELVKPTGRFYKNKIGFAMHVFAYYPCFECQKPYFGGLRRCDQNAIEAAEGFNKQELICGACCAKKSGQSLNCPKHGADFIEYKCKFCCSVANWFCWGNTHFCSQCHQKQVDTQKLTKATKNDLPQCKGPELCPIGGNHPEHPSEHAIGCSLCLRQQREEDAKGSL